MNGRNRTHLWRFSFFAVPINLWFCLSLFLAPMESTEYCLSIGSPEVKHPFLAHFLTFSTASRVLAWGPRRSLRGKSERGCEQLQYRAL